MMATVREKSNFHADAVQQHLGVLKLPFLLENHQLLAQADVEKHWSHLEYLSELASGETAAREDRRVERCIYQARFPVLKTLAQFDWNWPTKINRLLIKNLFHLDFVKQHANVVFVSGTGLGKTHLMTVLVLAACQKGHSVLFTGAIETVNTLTKTQASGSVKRALNHYIKPQVLCIDELAYLPIDKFATDCLFQILSLRYERGAILITPYRVYKQWPTIFNNDAVLTPALLDYLLRHVQTVRIEGKNFRSLGQIEV